MTFVKIFSFVFNRRKSNRLTFAFAFVFDLHISAETKVIDRTG